MTQKMFTEQQISFISLRTQPYAMLPSILHSILQYWQSVDGGEIGKGIHNNRIRDENLES